MVRPMRLVPTIVYLSFHQFLHQVDHLCFVVHGIGAACDIKFRPIAEVNTRHSKTIRRPAQMDDMYIRWWTGSESLVKRYPANTSVGHDWRALLIGLSFFL